MVLMLQRTVVEDNVINGVNPLGLESQECFQVPTEIVHLHNMNGKHEDKT